MSETHLELQKYFPETLAALIMSYTLEDYFRTLDEWYENRQGQYPRPRFRSEDLCPKAGGAGRITDLLIFQQGIQTRRTIIGDLLLREGSEFEPKPFTIEETSHGWWYRP
jgi:hypothetical protein